MYNSEQQTESLDAPRQLAEKGDAEAQYKLGTCYYKGIDIEPNAEEAFKWFVTAAKRKQLEAMFRLAHCYEKGIGTKSSQAKAIHWRYWAMNRMPSNPNDAYDSMETPMCGRIKVRKGGKYGFVDMKGHLVIPTEYDWAGSFDHIKLYGKWYIASPVSVQQRKWLIDSNNQPITSPIDIDKQYFIINDKLWVKQEQGYALVNLKWETLLQTDYQYIVNDRIHRPENVFLVKKQDYFGAIRVCDNNREQIILPF